MADSVEIPATVQQQMLTNAIMGQHVFNRETDLAFRRQADGAAFDMRVIGAVAASELLVSNDPADFARTNAAVRVPTTIDHPSAIVTK